MEIGSAHALFGLEGEPNRLSLGNAIGDGPLSLLSLRPIPQPQHTANRVAGMLQNEAERSESFKLKFVSIIMTVFNLHEMVARAFLLKFQ